MFGGPHDFSVSPRSPLGSNLGFELGWTWLGLGLEGLGTKDSGPGLDNLVSLRNLSRYNYGRRPGSLGLEQSIFKLT